MVIGQPPTPRDLDDPFGADLGWIEQVDVYTTVYRQQSVVANTVCLSHMFRDEIRNGNDPIPLGHDDIVVMFYPIMAIGVVKGCHKRFACTPGCAL